MTHQINLLSPPPIIERRLSPPKGVFLFFNFALALLRIRILRQHGIESVEKTATSALPAGANLVGTSDDNVGATSGRPLLAAGAIRLDAPTDTFFAGARLRNFRLNRRSPLPCLRSLVLLHCRLRHRLHGTGRYWLPLEGKLSGVSLTDEVNKSLFARN